MSWWRRWLVKANKTHAEVSAPVSSGSSAPLKDDEVNTSALEEEAIAAMNSGNLLKAGQLFLRLYRPGEVDSDRHITHVGFMVWNGVQKCFSSAGPLYTGLLDGSYAAELFITCVFHLFASESLDSPVAAELRETVDRVASALDHVITKGDSTYAMPIYAQILRGSGHFQECRTLIEAALTTPSVPTEVKDQLRGCIKNVPTYESDSVKFCSGVRGAYPEMTTVLKDQLRSYHELATKTRQTVCGEPADASQLG